MGDERRRRAFGDVLQRLAWTDPPTMRAIERLARQAEKRAQQRLLRVMRREAKKKAS
jgi:hypothetical protein